MGDAARNGAESFIWMIAVLSLGVGILNLFPIPVLDGGHLVFYAYEAVTGRPPSDRALRVLMSIGLTVVLSLMIFGLSRDLTASDRLDRQGAAGLAMSLALVHKLWESYPQGPQAFDKAWLSR